MNQEVKAQWIADLRSGKYPQGRGALRNSDGTFCCLGVLCEIAVDNGVLVRTELFKYRDADQRTIAGTLDDSSLMLEWAGLELGNGAGEFTTPQGKVERLTELNDRYDFTFSQIADVIDYMF